jgi:RNA polymerase sigma-70 factor (sigma-E family)
MIIGRRWTASSGEDELLSQLYQQVTERQAAQYAAGYDFAAGLDRYRAWLGEHAAEEHSGARAAQLQGSTARRAGLAGTGAGPAGQGTSEAAVASQATQGSTGLGTGTPAAGAGWEAARAVTALYSAHYRSLVRLTVLLVCDVATAEEIVQAAFMDLHVSWRRLPDSDQALPYLRRSVVNRSRSARHGVGKIAPELAPDLPAAEQKPVTQLGRSAVIAALWTLPPRQREALVLRCYADLSDAQIASAMGISIGAVKRHTARGMSVLRAALDKPSEQHP